MLLRPTPHRVRSFPRAWEHWGDGKWHLSYEDAFGASTPAAQPASAGGTFWYEDVFGLPTAQASPDGALSCGWNKTKQRIAITGQFAAGDTAGAAQTLKLADDYARANPGMPEARDLAQAWDRSNGITGGIKEVAGEFAKDWREAPGVIAGVKATGRNLRAMGEGLVEQVPNMIAPAAGMVAGGAAGARGGALGAAIGGFAGAAAGNTLVEGGGMVQEAQQKAGINPQDTAASERFLKAQGDTLLRQAGTKGAIIGAVDTLTAGLGGHILNAPARAAAERALAGMGVDAADKAAVQAAMKTPDFAARIAGDAAYRAATTGAENVARNVVAAALDPAGEFAREFVGQGVATGDWDTKNAALEAFSSLGQSGAMYAGQKAYQLATRPAGSRQAAAPGMDGAAEVSLPQQPGAEGTAAQAVTGEPPAEALAAPAINPADGPMSKAAALAGDLKLTPSEPAAPAPDVRQELGAVLDRLPPDQQRAARMTLADLERADLPAGVRAMRESEAQDLLASAAPAPQSVEDTPGGRVLQTFDPRAGGQPPSRFELTPEAAVGRADGIDFSTDAAPTPATDPAAERINQLALAAELTPGEPLRLNEAHALRQRAAEAGIPVAVVPIPAAGASICRSRSWAAWCWTSRAGKSSPGSWGLYGMPTASWATGRRTSTAWRCTTA